MGNFGSPRGRCTPLSITKGIIMSKKEKLYEKAIELYLGDYLLKEIQNKNHDALKIGYEIKELTFFVANLNPFMNIDSPISIEQLVTFSNNYLEVITKTINKNNGYVESINGDSIIALFGLNNDNHALNACKTARECLKEISKLNKRIGSVSFKRPENY